MGEGQGGGHSGRVRTLHAQPHGFEPARSQQTLSARRITPKRHPHLPQYPRRRPRSQNPPSPPQHGASLPLLHGGGSGRGGEVKSRQSLSIPNTSLISQSQPLEIPHFAKPSPTRRSPPPPSWGRVRDWVIPVALSQSFPLPQFPKPNPLHSPHHPTHAATKEPPCPQPPTPMPQPNA